MLIKNGGLESAMMHLKGVRTFFILSASNQTFRSVPAGHICSLQGLVSVWHLLPQVIKYNLVGKTWRHLVHAEDVRLSLVH